MIPTVKFNHFDAYNLDDLIFVMQVNDQAINGGFITKREIIVGN